MNRIMKTIRRFICNKVINCHMCKYGPNSVILPIIKTYQTGEVSFHSPRIISATIVWPNRASSELINALREQAFQAIGDAILSVVRELGDDECLVLGAPKIFQEDTDVYIKFGAPLGEILELIYVPVLYTDVGYDEIVKMCGPFEELSVGDTHEI